MTVNRWIAHLDMDAFYASVELLRYPELRGLPMVVGGRRVPAPVPAAEAGWQCAHLRDYVGRGVVTTATYEARALGVHSGLGLMKAAALAPQAILLPADFDAYRQQSRQFKAAVARLAPEIEDRGIDEIYIDLSHLDQIKASPSEALPQRLLNLARQIQQAVWQETGLSCSLGVSPNKLLSKLCSDLEKPHGLTLLLPGEIPTRIWPLPVARINGVGPKAVAKLDGLGIYTIGQLAAYAPADLMAHFGRHYGAWLHEAAHGRDDRPLETRREPKSLSRETTFERDLHAQLDRDELGAQFTRLCRQLAADLSGKQLRARHIGIKLRYGDFQTVTRDTGLAAATADATEIRLAAGRCLRRVNLDKRVRLLGVRATGLEPALDGQTQFAWGENLRLFG